MLSHVVFFTLKDSSQAAIDHLVAECHRYLKNHPGVVAFLPALWRPSTRAGE
jgi:hypothetical protein